jgi:hypothetical protein
MAEAPAGARWAQEEVKTKGGTESLGTVPILVWDNLEAARNYYGEEGLLAVLDGTSLRVSFQSIARRFRTAKKTDDELQTAQVNFKPGKRVVGAPTPESKVRKAAAVAAEKTGNAEGIEKLLAAIADGKLSQNDIDQLVGASS